MAKTVTPAAAKPTSRKSVTEKTATEKTVAETSPKAVTPRASKTAAKAAKPEKTATAKPTVAAKAPPKAAAPRPAPKKAPTAKAATASKVTEKAPAKTAAKPTAKATDKPTASAKTATAQPSTSAKAGEAKSAPAKTAAGKTASATPASRKAAPKPAKTAMAKDDTKALAAGPIEVAETSAPSASPAEPVQPKRWLASYPENVPADIPGLPADSIGALIENACRQYGARVAFTSMGVDLTYSDLEKQSAAFGAYLQDRGLRPGARVALMMPNVLQYPIALVGALRAGFTVVNINPLYTARELKLQLKDSGAEAIVILENFAGTLAKVLGNTVVKHVIVAALGDRLGMKGLLVNLVVRRVKKMVPAWTIKDYVTFNAALKTGASKSLKPVKVGPEDIAFLQYTGGTTGISKGAMLTHANVLANIAQNAAWLESAFIKRKRPEKGVYVCALPLYHIYALTVNALMGMQQGAQNVLIANPRDIPAFVKDLAKVKFTVFPGLNTLFNALLNNADFQKLDFKSLVLTFGGGMAVQQTVADRWKKLTGCVISEGYGLSETSPVATANSFGADSFSGTIGLPLPSTEISIRGEDDREMAVGEVGEICIRGPQVMKGYWNRPDETAKVMSGDGFFRSGDMGFMDDKGFTKIVDRKKDMILVSGFNVYPNEIEEIVSRHPGVLEVAAVGVPDEKSGEVPKLFVVRRDENLSEEDLRSYCRENLTAYKRPRHFEFRKELPKTNVGKILRRELRG